MSSDFRIDPSTTSTTLDYGENPNQDTGGQGDGSSNKDQQSKTYLNHQSEHLSDESPSLKKRKTRKKKKKIAERKTRQDSENR